MRDVTVVQPPRSYDSLPKRNKEFIRIFVETGDLEEAFKGAGYKADRSRIRAKARKLRQELSVHIDEQLREHIKSTDMAIMAIGTLRDLAQNADSENVRKGAAESILDRAGYSQPTEVHHKHETINDDRKILERMKELRKELMNDEKVVSEQ